MTENKLNEIKQLTRQHIEKRKISQAQFANHVGVSPTTISQWLRGAYPGNEEEVATRVDDYFATERLREEYPVEFNFVETSVALQVRDALMLTKRIRRMIIITSQPGDGKTEALNHYADKQTVMLTCRSTMNTHNMLADLASKVKVSTKNSTDHILRRVVDSFISKPRTLVIDEAQHLRPRSLDAIRYIWDMAKIPLLISGNDELVQTLQSDTRLRQILSRLTYIRVVRISYEDSIKLIRQIFPTCNEQIMRKIYESAVSTRDMCDFVLTTKTLCANNGLTAPTMEIIKKVAALKLAA